MTDEGAVGIRPIAELFRGDCVALWATTYNVELNLFNEYLLRRLGDVPLNAVVLADRHRLDESLAAIPGERLDTLTHVNRRWLLRGVQFGSGRFHPKSYLAVRPRTATLMVGSGNLSTNGIDIGREVFTTFTTGNPVGEAAIATWRSWMRRLVGASGDTLLAERFADLEQRFPKPERPVVVADTPLWHNLDAPVGPRFCDAVATLTPTVDELIATAPFFDEMGEALGYVVDRLRPKLVRLYTTTSTSVDGPALLRRLRDAGCDVELFAYEPDRFTHAKLLGAIAGANGWLLSGSANLSRAALTLVPGPANVELAVFCDLDAEELRATFLPPGVDAAPRQPADFGDLTYRSDETASARFPIRLHRAMLAADGRVQVLAEPAPTAATLLADHHRRSALDTGPSSALTVDALDGPLVRLENHDGVGLSNWAVIEDPAALARALAVAQSGGSSYPAELVGGDFHTPLGRALLYLHRNLVMDASEIRTATSGGSGVTNEESLQGADDDLWERLERETLSRDPRTGSYGRILATRGSIDALTDPLVELLDVMRDRVPSRFSEAPTGTVLARLVREHQDGAADRPKVTWSTTARLRVRTRNVLRRWAAAQTDPRLVWVHPLAPLVNLRTVAATFVNLHLHAAYPDHPTELDHDDLNDLWARWLKPIVGTGHQDGWLDRAGLTADDVADHLTNDFVEMASALCWLAIRRGAAWRERLVDWRPTICAALDSGLLDDNATTAAYLSIIVGRDVPTGQLTEDFLHAIDFMDDRLWCDQTARNLELDSLDLETGPAGPRSVKLLVKGVSDPLHDPRLARLVVSVRAYRSADTVAVYAAEVRRDWRIVVEPGQPAYFLSNLEGDALESAPLDLDDLDQLAAGDRVLADLFPRRAEVA